MPPSALSLRESHRCKISLSKTRETRGFRVWPLVFFGTMKFFTNGKSATWDSGLQLSTQINHIEDIVSSVNFLFILHDE